MAFIIEEKHRNIVLSHKELCVLKQIRKKPMKQPAQLPDVIVSLRDIGFIEVCSGKTTDTHNDTMAYITSSGGGYLVYRNRKITKTITKVAMWALPLIVSIIALLFSIYTYCVQQRDQNLRTLSSDSLSNTELSYNPRP